MPKRLESVVRGPEQIDDDDIGLEPACVVVVGE
jgi:hypothetical protein